MARRFSGTKALYNNLALELTGASLAGWKGVLLHDAVPWLASGSLSGTAFLGSTVSGLEVQLNGSQNRDYTRNAVAVWYVPQGFDATQLLNGTGTQLSFLQMCQQYSDYLWTYDLCSPRYGNGTDLTEWELRVRPVTKRFFQPGWRVLVVVYNMSQYTITTNNAAGNLEYYVRPKAT